MDRLLAQDASNGIRLDDPLTNPTAKLDSVGSLMNVLGPIAMIIGGLICLAMLFTGAFTYITAGGEHERIQKAKRTITYSLIGLVVMICAVLFVNILGYVFKVNTFFQK